MGRSAIRILELWKWGFGLCFFVLAAAPSAEALVLVQRHCWRDDGGSITLDFSAYDKRFVRVNFTTTTVPQYCVMSLESTDREVIYKRDECNDFLAGHRDVLVYKHRSKEKFLSSSGIRIDCPFERLDVEGRLADMNHEAEGAVTTRDAKSGEVAYKCI